MVTLAKPHRCLYGEKCWIRQLSPTEALLTFQPGRVLFWSTLQSYSSAYIQCGQNCVYVKILDRTTQWKRIMNKKNETQNFKIRNCYFSKFMECFLKCNDIFSLFIKDFLDFYMASWRSKSTMNILLHPHPHKTEWRSKFLIVTMLNLDTRVHLEGPQPENAPMFQQNSCQPYRSAAEDGPVFCHPHLPEFTPFLPPALLSTDCCTFSSGRPSHPHC